MYWPSEGEDTFPEQRPTEPANLRQDILDELSDHFDMAIEREQEQCDNEEDAVWCRVLQRFGNPKAVARRLWWDAMKEQVMREWIQTAVTVVIAVAIVVFMVTAVNQMQMTSQAVLQALNNNQGNAPAMTTLDFKVTRVTADGPPAAGIEVKVIGKLFREESDYIVEVTGADGLVSIGPLQQGKYKVTFTDPETGMERSKGIAVLGAQARKDVYILAPDIAPVEVFMDFGLPEYSSDKHQLVMCELTSEWGEGEGDDVWRHRQICLVGSKGTWCGKWAMKKPPERSGSREFAKGNLGRSWYSRPIDWSISLEKKKEGLWVQGKRFSIDRTRILLCGDDEAEAAFCHIDSRLQSGHYSRQLEVRYSLNGQQFELVQDQPNHFKVDLPDELTQAFGEEARLYLASKRLDEFNTRLVETAAAQFDEHVITETHLLQTRNLLRNDNGLYAYSPPETTVLVASQNYFSNEPEQSALGHIPLSADKPYPTQRSQARILLALYGTDLNINTFGNDLQLCALSSPWPETGWPLHDAPGRRRPPRPRSSESQEPSDSSTPGLALEMPTEQVWSMSAEELNTSNLGDSWLLIDVTESVRNAESNEAIHGFVLSWQTKGGNYIQFVNSENRDMGYKEYLPRLLIMEPIEEVVGREELKGLGDVEVQG